MAFSFGGFATYGVWTDLEGHNQRAARLFHHSSLVNDGNKSLYLVFVGVVFFSASWTAFRAVRTTSWTAFRAVRTAASWLFLLGQQDSNILTAFRTSVSI
jgi:hypothetical protein